MGLSPFGCSAPFVQNWTFFLGRFLVLTRLIVSPPTGFSTMRRTRLDGEAVMRVILLRIGALGALIVLGWIAIASAQRDDGNPPAAESADSIVAVCSRKSLQLLSVSVPSGKRPVLVLGVLTGAAPPRMPKLPRPALGAGAVQPLWPEPDIA